jgi:hypothetical protein
MDETVDSLINGNLLGISSERRQKCQTNQWRAGRIPVAGTGNLFARIGN